MAEGTQTQEDNIDQLIRLFKDYGIEGDEAIIDAMRVQLDYLARITVAQISPDIEVARVTREAEIKIAANNADSVARAAMAKHQAEVEVAKANAEIAASEARAKIEVARANAESIIKAAQAKTAWVGQLAWPICVTIVVLTTGIVAFMEPSLSFIHSAH